MLTLCLREIIEGAFCPMEIRAVQNPKLHESSPHSEFHLNLQIQTTFIKMCAERTSLSKSDPSLEQT